MGSKNPVGQIAYILILDLVLGCYTHIHSLRTRSFPCPSCIRWLHRRTDLLHLTGIPLLRFFGAEDMVGAEDIGQMAWIVVEILLRWVKRVD